MTTATYPRKERLVEQCCAVSSCTRSNYGHDLRAFEELPVAVGSSEAAPVKQQMEFKIDRFEISTDVNKRTSQV
jgi:hypothetical protein